MLGNNWLFKTKIETLYHGVYSISKVKYIMTMEQWPRGGNGNITFVRFACHRYSRKTIFEGRWW